NMVFSRKDSQSLLQGSTELLKLAFVESFSETSDQTDDDFLGTSEKKVVGDTWGINTARIRDKLRMERHPLQDKDHVEGTGKLAGVTKVGAVTCLDLEAIVHAKRDLAGTKPGVRGAVTFDFVITSRVPADYSTGPLRRTLKAKVRIDGNEQG